jgi:MYXO-CTERM domain-containing protein
MPFAATPSGSFFSRIALAVVLGLYAASFLLPVADAGEHQEILGYQAFFWAPLTIVYLPMWLANPVLWLGCACAGDQGWRAARNAGLAAVLLAVSEVWLWDDPPELGYYLWVASMVALGLAGLIGVYCLPSAGTTEAESVNATGDSRERAPDQGVAAGAP